MPLVTDSLGDPPHTHTHNTHKHTSTQKQFQPLRTVVAYMWQRNKLDYHAQTNRYNFATLHPINLKLLSLCSVYSAENSYALGRM